MGIQDNKAYQRLDRQLFSTTDREHFYNMPHYIAWVKRRIDESLKAMGVKSKKDIKTINFSAPSYKDHLYISMVYQLIAMIESPFERDIRWTWKQLLDIGPFGRFDFSYRAWLNQN